MSEYWKSTPKYWCKFCKTYVKDTKFEKQQHEATPRHQGNIQRSLRTMHRENEREGREQQRAKDEVARLNGLVGSSSGAPSSTLLKPPGSSSSALALKANPEDRKRQLSQLASLGVAVPDEYRADLGMVGDWQTLSVRRLDGSAPSGRGPNIKQENEFKPDVDSIGVRKRRFDPTDGEEGVSETVVRKGWGSTIRTYPGEDKSDQDIEALLKSGVAESLAAKPPSKLFSMPRIKREASDNDVAAPEMNSERDGRATVDASIKSEDETAEAPVVFKKRKAKTMRGT